MEEQKESKIFTYTYSATEKTQVKNKKLTKREVAEIQKIRQEYIMSSQEEK